MCNNSILISKIFNTGDVIELIPNRTVKKENLGDLCKYNLIIGCGLQCEESLPVVIVTDTAKIPVYNKYGNDVYYNQIKRNRYAFCLGYGNNNSDLPDGQFVVFNNLCLPSPTITPAFFKSSKKGKSRKEDDE